MTPKTAILENVSQTFQNGVFCCSVSIILIGTKTVLYELSGFGSTYDVARANAYHGLVLRLKDKFLE